MDRNEARRVLLEISSILDYLRIPFFLIQGTALGAYRDKDFPSTDRDIDIGILIENFQAEPLLFTLVRYGYDIEAFVPPFNFIRTVVAWKNCIHVDIVGWIKHNNFRYTIGPDREWTVDRPYALVQEADMLENYQEVELFDRIFKVPYPIEAYLKREYGDWKTPQEDVINKSRVYNFLKLNNIPTTAPNFLTRTFT